MSSTPPPLPMRRGAMPPPRAPAPAMSKVDARADMRAQVGGASRGRPAQLRAGARRRWAQLRRWWWLGQADGTLSVSRCGLLAWRDGAEARDGGTVISLGSGRPNWMYQGLPDDVMTQ